MTQTEVIKVCVRATISYGQNYNLSYAVGQKNVESITQTEKYIFIGMLNNNIIVLNTDRMDWFQLTFEERQREVDETTTSEEKEQESQVNTGDSSTESTKKAVKKTTRSKD